MPAAQTTIATQNAATYLARLAGHTGKMAAATGRLRHGRRTHGAPTHGAPTGSAPTDSARTHSPSAQEGDVAPRIREVRRDGDAATVILDRGQWTMRADTGRLDILIQADDEADLRRVQDLLTTRVRGLAHREQLTIAWHAVCGLPVLATDTVSAACIGTRVGSEHE